jgi:signal transduction histidine kinase
MAVSDRSPRSTEWIRSALVSVAAVAVTGVAWLLGWLPPMERVTGDFLLRTSTTESGRDPQVIAVLIDDLAVDRLGPLPWPRDRLADLIAAVHDSGATGVAIDLILSDASTVEADRALAEALAGSPKVLAAAFDKDGKWLLPIPALGGAASAAHAYGEVGPDGVVRTVAATKQAHGLSLPALSLAAARLVMPEIAIEAGVEIRPEFRPAPQSLPILSAARILDGSFDRNEISGRLVFIGLSATGAGDQFVVPTGPRHAPVPGVVAHASAATSIIHGRLLRVLDFWWTLAAAVILSFGVQVIRNRRGAFDIASFMGLAVGLVLIASAAVRFGLLLMPATTLLTAAVMSALLREAIESRSARLESGRLLQALLEHVGATRSAVPRTAHTRLGALRRLQERVLEEDATRRALLTGMDEGVVLWNAAGEVVLANPAAERLWGSLAELGELASGPVTPDPLVVPRGGRQLAVGLTDLERGRLAIIRDISAEHALERRRQEMQRLVSHELKTPLASIAGFGEALERYELSADEQRRVAALIRGEAGRLQEMVTVFLDLERLGGGHWVGSTDEVDFGRLVTSRLEVLEAAANARGLELRASIEDDCKVHGVPALLDRVVDNLVGNAIKYSAEDTWVDIGVEREGENIVMRVRDCGPGIPEQHRQRIFDRFYRIPGSPGAGAGLGLALAKEVVDWHGGCIEMESEIGAGSTLMVRLPVSGET